MKAIYKGPSDRYITGSSVFERNGAPEEIQQKQLNAAQAAGHRFEVVKEPVKRKVESSSSFDSETQEKGGLTEDG